VATRMEAQALVSQLLLDHIREDPYPSVTQMNILEETIPLDMVDEYLDILAEKVTADRFPSIPMLRRLQRVAESLPVYQR
jgi:hypothetical protein